MKRLLFLFMWTLFVLLVLGVLAFSGLRAADAPDKLTFESKMGNVTFDHAKHLEREGGDCKTCHDKLFPQSRAPLNFKTGMHKPAEAKKASCAGCHHPGGKSFEAKGNCKNCHVKK